MKLVRPRLNDYYNLPFTQEEVSFAIPFLDEDIPLYVDPFRLWSSSSLQENSLHTAMVDAFNFIGHSYLNGEEEFAISHIIQLSECEEVGLGTSTTRSGLRIGETKARDILGLFKAIPQIKRNGFQHIETAMLLINNIGADRISDITCNLIKSFLIDYTEDQCKQTGIPIEEQEVYCFNFKSKKIEKEIVSVPRSPSDGKPVIFIPRRWLRFRNWISVDDYTQNYFKDKIWDNDVDAPDRISILDYNRKNFDAVEGYIKIKEARSEECINDPLFQQIPVRSAKTRLNTILKLKTGNKDKADKIYEDNLCSILASAFYPRLDFCKDQSRTESGVLIRDLIFYNNRSYDFLENIYDDYESKQIVIEIKNVKELEREHINQLNRYLNDSFGRFGILFTRNKPKKSVYKNTIDLWSGQRRCILILDDDDLKMICDLFESKQREPIDVIKKKFVEFSRACPS